MRRQSRSYLIQLLVTALLAMALTSSAFAHRLPTSDDLALEAFLRSGGSYADLCSEVSHDGPQRDGCPLCPLVTPATLPLRPVVARPEGLHVAMVWTADEAAAPVVERPRRANNPRDPPLF